MSKITKYKNRKTDRKVIILKRERGLVQVEYMYSKNKSWFRLDDLIRIFEEIQ